MIKKLQNIYFYSFLNFIDKILIFLLPLIVLKLYNDKDIYNSLEYIYSIAVIIVIFFDFGLKNYTFYFLKKSSNIYNDIKKIEDTFYFFLLFFTSFLILFFIFFKKFYNEILILIFIRAIYLTIINFYKIYFRAKDIPSRIFVFSILVSILTILVMIWNFFYYNENSLLKLFFIIQIFFIGLYFIFQIKIINNFRSNIKSYLSILKNSISFSYPLMLSILFYNFMLNYGKIYSFNFLSEQEMSFLSLIQRIFIILTFFHATYVSYFQKKIFISDDKVINKKIFLDYFKIIFSLSIFLLLLTPLAANYVGIEILNKKIVILLFSHSLLWCLSTFFDMYLTKTNHNKSIFINMLFSLVIFASILFSFQNNFLLAFCLALNISTIAYLFLIIFKIKKIGIKFTR